MSRLTQKGATGPLNLFQTTSETVVTAPYSNSTTFAGERFDSADGREFVLVQNGAVALAAGKLVQAPPITAAHQNMAVTAFTAASTTTGLPAQVTVTLGAGAVTVNQYAGGYLVVNDNNGEGQTLKVASHAAADSAASLVVYLEDSPVTAITTASEVSLIPNLYVGVVINPTTATNTPIGVALYAIAASSAVPAVAGTTNVFGLIQSKGPTSALAQGAIGVGLGVMPSTSVAGAFAVIDATGANIGRALQAGVDTEYRTLYVDM